MGNLAGILVMGDDFTGDGVCDDRKSRLALNVEVWLLWTECGERTVYISPYCCSKGVATISKAKIHCWSNESQVEQECCKHPFHIMNQVQVSYEQWLNC